MKSTFNFGDITLEFLNAFREIQFELQCESSMNTVETYSRVKEFRKLQNLYTQHILSQKNHFLKIYQIFQKFYFHKNHPPNFFYEINQSEILLEEDHRKIPTLSQFSTHVTNVTDSEVIECLTFSTIPAYFSYFVSTFENENLISFFTQIKEYDNLHQKNYFDIYARSIFISPFFLCYISYALQNFFSSHLLNDLNSGNFDSIIQQVKKQWRDKIQYLPSFVYDILKISPNPAQTLSKSFFEIALQNINDSNSFAQVYFLIYLGQFPSKEYLSAMTQLFSYSSEANILNDLIQILFESYNDDKPNEYLIRNIFPNDFFFNDKDKMDAPSLFQPFLFSTLDYAVIDFITGESSSFAFPNNYEIFTCFHENETLEQSIHNIDESTMANDGLQAKAALRHLLQLSDTLPVFQRVPDNLSIEDFFNIYLVNRGPLETLTKRTELSKVVQLLCTFDNPQNILTHLYETVLDRTKEIRALSAFTAISDKIIKQIQASKFTLVQTEKNYDSIFIIGPKLSVLNSNSASVFSISANFLLTSNFLPKQNPFFTENSVEKYYNYPSLLMKDMENILKSFSKDLTKSKDIIYARLTRNFNINNLIVSRKNLIQADCEVSNYITQNPQMFLEKNFIIKKPPPQFDTNRWLIEQLNFCKEDECLRQLLIDASEESYPLRKATIYNSLLFYLRSILIRNFPPEKGEIGADQFVPSEAAFYWLVNPDKIVTNYVFLHDYLFNNYYKDFIDVTDIVGILKLIIQAACPKIDLQSLCKIND